MTGDAVLMALAIVLPAYLGTAAMRFFRTHARGDVRWPALLLGNALVLASILSVLFLGFESYYRYVRDVTDGDALTKGSTRWFERHWSTNAFQFRDDIEYPLRRSKDGPRLSFFGDSFTAGHGVSDVGDRFVNRIRAARPDWEAHAIAGLGASTQTQSLALGRLLDRGYELDTVVLVYCFNDIDPFIPELESVFRNLTQPPPVWLGPLIRHSYFANSLHYIWRVTGGAPDGANYFDLIEPAYEGPAWETEKELLRRVRAAVESGGGRLVTVTFPMLVRLGRGENEDHVMHAKLEAFWRAERVPHLDLLPLLHAHKGERLVVSAFDDHPSAFAHGLAAEAILDFLETPHPGRPALIAPRD